MRTINSFAAAVHRLRRARGMSVGDIAAKTGYSISYLSKLLNGRRPLQPAVVSEIDKALHAEGELEQIAQAQTAGETALSRPMQLPPVGADFVGREDYLHRMDEALIAQDRPGAAVTVVIGGGFWVGKTALALRWAARVQGRFPGGSLFADLRGLAPGEAADPGDVLDAFLRALGAGSDAGRGSVADRAARYRSLLAERPAVVVLDNIASYEQVHQLLPGAGCAVVVTSREHQSALLLRSGGLHIDLPPLSLDEALTLLRRRVGDARVNVDPSAAEAVVGRCGRLPMAVLIAAEHIQQRHHGSLGSLAEDLATDARLDLFTSPDPAVNIGAVIDLSYLALPPRVARVFRLLGICPTRLVSDESTAALTGLSLPQARDALDVLRHAHLLDDAPSGRMHMNQLLRAYAAQKAVAEESLSEVEQARDRVLRWYVATAWAAGNALAPNWSGTALAPHTTADIEPLTFAENGYDAALAWCDAEAETAVHIARHARSYAAHDVAWILPTLWLPYFYVSKRWGTWLRAATESLAAARAIGSRHGVAWTLLSLGWAQHELARTDEAVAHLNEALRLRTELDDNRMQGWTLFALGSAYLALGRHHQARNCLDRADDLFTALDFDFGLAFTRATLAQIHQASGETDAASEAAYDALSRAQNVPSTPVSSLAHHQLGILLHQQHQYRPALTHLDSALILRRRSRERWGEAGTLVARAEVLSALNEPVRARESYLEAADILETLRDPRVVDIQTKVAALDSWLRSRDLRVT